MTPVMLLTDGYLANASEPWIIPDMDAIELIETARVDQAEGLLPFDRDPETNARPWITPGTPGGIHRIGGIERAAGSGNISYDPDNHQAMTDVRAAKIDGIAREYDAQGFELGGVDDDVLVLGWGSSYGPINRAVSNLRDKGLKVGHLHLRHIWPLPADLGGILENFERILVPEMNNGQLATLLRSEYLVKLESMPKVSGKPFKVSEIEAAVRDGIEGVSQ